MKEKNSFSPYKIISLEIKNLRSKEAQVIEKRFGLNGNNATLASIGRDLKLSRERVRQIEKEALKKLSINIINKYDNVIRQIILEFENSGGYIAKNDVYKKILSEGVVEEEKEKKSLVLFIRLLPDLIFIEKHNDLHDSWIHKSVSTEEMIKILDSWIKTLSISKSPEKIDLLIKSLPENNKYQMSFLMSLPKISKKMIETYKKDIALSDWPEFNPKTVRDKIFYILKKNQKPMHFSEIARAIKQEEFDGKKVVMATVHNELIADSRFVLIGRGIYALAEWGYKDGTVKDIIKEVLSNSRGALEVSDIFNQVQKQRVVRKNTVLINLQTQKEFKKIGHNKYILA